MLSSRLNNESQERRPSQLPFARTFSDIAVAGSSQSASAPSVTNDDLYVFGEMVGGHRMRPGGPPSPQPRPSGAKVLVKEWSRRGRRVRDWWCVLAFACLRPGAHAGGRG